MFNSRTGENETGSGHIPGTIGIECSPLCPPGPLSPSILKKKQAKDKSGVSIELHIERQENDYYYYCNY